MTLLVIQHPVADFEGWKRSFDRDPLGRARHGVKRYSIFRPADEPGTVVVNLEFAARDQAEAFLLKLRPLWQEVGKPLGFGGSQGVLARVLDEIEHVEY